MGKLLFLVFSAAVLVAVANLVRAGQRNLQPIVKIFNALHKEPQAEILEPKESEENVKTLWIEQKLNHFDENEYQTWQMRYLANDEFYKSGGPVFIFVGGEWSISAGAISKGQHIYDMARNHSGYLFYTEHRFYGKSMPVKAFTNENMKYLSVEQALADLAHFIRTMKSTILGMKNSKAILVGGSYSGTMVTWFKKLYPDLAAGCWASSAPLFALADYYQYKIIMGESIELMAGTNCNDRIRKGFAELESMFENKRGAEAKAMLKLCNSFNEHNDLDVFTLFYEMSELFAALVQTHNTDEIQNGCHRIMEGSSDVIGLANYIMDTFAHDGCTDLSYDSYLSFFKNSSSDNMMRAWIYQTCNEFGWFQTAAEPFGTQYPLDFFTTLCGDAYGPKFTNEFIQQSVQKTNDKFGNLRPKVENVYWTQGELDPWKAVGMQNEATIIPYHAHCKDFNSISSKDSTELKSSKDKIAALVKEWLK